MYSMVCGLLLLSIEKVLAFGVYLLWVSLVSSRMAYTCFVSWFWIVLLQFCLFLKFSKALMCS